MSLIALPSEKRAMLWQALTAIEWRAGGVQLGAACLIIPRDQTKTKKLPLTIPLTSRAADIVHRNLERATPTISFSRQSVMRIPAQRSIAHYNGRRS